MKKKKKKDLKSNCDLEHLIHGTSGYWKQSNFSRAMEAIGLLGMSKVLRYLCLHKASPYLKTHLTCFPHSHFTVWLLWGALCKQPNLFLKLPSAFSSPVPIISSVPLRKSCVSWTRGPALHLQLPGKILSSSIFNVLSRWFFRVQISPTTSNKHDGLYSI